MCTKKQGSLEDLAVIGVDICQSAPNFDPLSASKSVSDADLVQFGHS